MLKFAPPMFALLLLAPAAHAQQACEACRAEDLQQVGPYIEPELPAPAIVQKPDPRGTEHRIPLPGGAASVHVKPGAGLWVGSPGEGRGDVFVNGTRDKASVGWRLGF